MRYVVGYAANARGGDAVNLAVALARRQGASLDLVMVMPEDSPYNGVYPPVAGFGDILAEQISHWIDEGLALVPDDVPAQAHIRRGESEAEALIAAAEELGAELLVIGASSSGLFKRFSIGSVASALLHAATVPVVLAPSGYSRTDPITRLTCALGTRAGAEDVLRTGLEMAKRRCLPLRLVSLVALGQGDATASIEEARAHLRSVAEASQGLAAADLDKPEIDVVVGHGRTIEDAVDGLNWKKGEILLIGSSRLAQNKSIFLGSTANRILRALPVPMIVVPRNFEFPTNEVTK
ncbi:Nucleotide-binding universal stress protein, UspA family [Arthrobacter alpinus]|uniref:Nucleotide-binding universal stress protein, UspA family n=1 Tax=Arthrobacter alpinus TaxID=656366 RepID=A0A1H5N2Y1_9MICC|nr:universal stress protein [Arthrobacter alpinus]SEE95297.1 Nucleotide-binding universal stress protein, UspA family [Arthrobacter alpinus]